jgi:hypothetical protein
VRSASLRARAKAVAAAINEASLLAHRDAGLIKLGVHVADPDTRSPTASLSASRQTTSTRRRAWRRA